MPAHGLLFLRRYKKYANFVTLIDSELNFVRLVLLINESDPANRSFIESGRSGAPDRSSIIPGLGRKEKATSTKPVAFSFFVWCRLPEYVRTKGEINIHPLNGWFFTIRA